VLEVGSVQGLLSSGVLEWEIGVDSLSGERVALLKSQGHRVDPVGSHWVVRVEQESTLQQVLRDLTQDRAFIRSVEPRRESLEDHFVRALEADGGPHRLEADGGARR